MVTSTGRVNTPGRMNMKTYQKTEEAKLSIIEKPDSFKLVRTFHGFSRDTVKNMAYSYVKRILEPLDIYHHRPQIYDDQKGGWTAKIIGYGNVTVIDKNGTEVYNTSGLPQPVEEEIDIPIIQGNNIIQVKDERKVKK